MIQKSGSSPSQCSKVLSSDQSNWRRRNRDVGDHFNQSAKRVREISADHLRLRAS